MKNNQKNTSAVSAGRMSKKTVALLLAFTLLLGTAIGGAVAYLMDKTDPVVNTFTYGNIDIELDETEGGENHEFKMMPGVVIAKDPVVTVKEGSEDNWLYVKLDESENFDAFMTYEMADGWTQLDGYDNIWYREVNASDTESKDVAYSVLKDDQVQVKTTVTKELFDALGENYPTLTVTAYAVQRDATQSALETAEKAWLAIPAQASTAEDVRTAVADINNTDAAATITLENDIEDGSGLVLNANGTDSNLTMDFNEKTYTVTNAVGSSGTESQAAHFEKGSTVLLKDGTLTKAGNNVKMLVQNYADLTIDNMELNGADADYVLSCNYGNTLITGNTNITAASGKVAIDVMHWVNDSYKDGVTVTIDEHMSGTVDGAICVYKYESGQEDYENCPLAKLIIKGGTFKNTGLTLEQFRAFVANGYEVSETENGVYTVSKAN